MKGVSQESEDKSRKKRKSVIVILRRFIPTPVF